MRIATKSSLIRTRFYLPFEKLKQRCGGVEVKFFTRRNFYDLMAELDEERAEENAADDSEYTNWRNRSEGNEDDEPRVLAETGD